ncbi:MAG: EVE domain-containing protein [Pseudomonadota bacterium]|nr:EVE domain-containing protein [Alphaproteobacteria bacterium]MDP5370412.1 EVE domain-containing protein [Pseudomonadota bacterium]
MTYNDQSFWLIKSEPSTWSWADQVAKGIEPWEGVRNYQARNNLKAMKIGDLCFFYHSVKERSIKGIVEVVSDYRLDPTDHDGVFGLVDVKAVRPLKKSICLDQIKLVPALQEMALLKQSRLSVQPITAEEWAVILHLSGE